MGFYRKLIFKKGDFIFRQERRRELTPLPELTKLLRKDPYQIFDEDFQEKHLEEGKRYFVWKSSRQTYLPILFDGNFVFIEG